MALPMDEQWHRLPVPPKARSETVNFGDQASKPVTIDDLDTVVMHLVGLAELNVDRTGNHQTTALRPLRAAAGDCHPSSGLIASVRTRVPDHVP